MVRVLNSIPCSLRHSLTRTHAWQLRRMWYSLGKRNASHQAASRITCYEDSFSLLTCQHLFSSSPAVFHKGCFSMELPLKPTVRLLLVVINKRIALAASKLCVIIIVHCIQLLVKDLHFVVINNSLKSFRGAKQPMWKTYLQRNWFTWEYSELKLNKVNCHMSKLFTKLHLGFKVGEATLKCLNPSRWRKLKKQLWISIHKGVNSGFKHTKHHINLKSTIMIAIKLWTFHSMRFMF